MRASLFLWTRFRVGGRDCLLEYRAQLLSLSPRLSPTSVFFYVFSSDGRSVAASKPYFGSNETQEPVYCEPTHNRASSRCVIAAEPPPLSMCGPKVQR